MLMSWEERRALELQSARQGPPVRLWVARISPAPEGWWFSDRCRALKKCSDVDFYITEEVIATLPRLRMSRAPLTEEILGYEEFAKAGLDVALLYHPEAAQ